MSIKLIALIVALVSVVPFGNTKEITEEKIDSQLEEIEDRFTPRILGELFGTIKGCRLSGRISKDSEAKVLGEGRFEEITDAKIQSPQNVIVFDTAFYLAFDNAHRGDVSCKDFSESLSKYVDKADRYNQLISLSKATKNS